MRPVSGVGAATIDDEAALNRTVKKDGQMTSRSSRILTCVLALAVLVSGCGKQSSGSPSTISRITANGFEQISEGMTWKQVTAALGEPQDAGGVKDGRATTKLGGVPVSQSASWTDESNDVKKQIQIGFHEGKVAAAIYRDGEDIRIKPEVPDGRFRLISDWRSANTMEVIAGFGSPEEFLLTLGVGESADQLMGFEADTPPQTTMFTVSGRLVDDLEGSGQSLEIVLKRSDPESTFTSNFAVDEGKTLADVLAFDFKSDLYEPGEPIIIGIITGQNGKKHNIILHVTPLNALRGQAT